MQSAAILEQLEAMRKEMDSFNNNLTNVRYGDFKRIFIDQMQQALRDSSQEFLDAEMTRMDHSSSCPNKKMCVEKITGAVESTITSFINDDVGSALNELDEIEELISGGGSHCQDNNCSKFASTTIHQIRTLLIISDKVQQRLDEERSARSPVPDRNTAEAISPSTAEMLLAPLSNSWRISILRILRSGESTFSEISKELNLKTGHLQFHMKELKGTGYIEVDAKKHIYAITPRGRVAVDGIERIVTELDVLR